MSEPKASVSCTVVIPTYRRPEAIERCLVALSKQEGCGRFRVVIVEDGGADPRLAELRARTFDSIEVTWLDQEHLGPATARNLGASHAATDTIAFTDDDCRPRPDWLQHLLARLESHPASVVGGHTVNALPENRFSAASQDLVSFITEFGVRSGTPFFASNNLAISRETFAGLGGFDTSFPLAGGEDRDLCDRALEAGIELIHAPEAVIDHDHRLSATSFWRQHFRYGRGAQHLHAIRAQRRVANSTVIPPVRMRFYRELIGYPFSTPGHPRRLTTSMLLLLSQVPHTLGFFSEKLRGSRSASKKVI